MKLLDDLFSIVSCHSGEDGVEYAVRLNPEHFIYRAHFPGLPITPGVCILQMCIELLGKWCGMPLVLECAKNIKFLRVIAPDKNPDLRCLIGKICREEGQVRCQISVMGGDDLYAKLSLICQRVD